MPKEKTPLQTTLYPLLQMNRFCRDYMKKAILMLSLGINYTGKKYLQMLNIQVVIYMMMNLRLIKFSFRQIKRYTLDRKSTRLNSSHVAISYAVFCLNKTKYEKHQ